MIEKWKTGKFEVIRSKGRFVTVKKFITKPIPYIPRPLKRNQVYHIKIQYPEGIGRGHPFFAEFYLVADRDLSEMEIRTLFESEIIKLIHTGDIDDFVLTIVEHNETNYTIGYGDYTNLQHQFEVVKWGRFETNIVSRGKRCLKF